jgi:hypothetical protein
MSKHPRSERDYKQRMRLSLFGEQAPTSTERERTTSNECVRVHWVSKRQQAQRKSHNQSVCSSLLGEQASTGVRKSVGERGKHQRVC